MFDEVIRTQGMSTSAAVHRHRGNVLLNWVALPMHHAAFSVQFLWTPQTTGPLGIGACL